MITLINRLKKVVRTHLSLFARVFVKAWGWRRLAKAVHRKSPLNHQLSISYAPTFAYYLNMLCDKYGSDKGELSPYDNPYPWRSHQYTEIYDLLFSQHRKGIKRLIECGIGTNNPAKASNMSASGRPGASLRVWRDYFPSAHIIGIDIDEDILFTEERISTYCCDQTSKQSIQAFIQAAKLQPRSIDIIIDDGLHTLSACTCLFETLHPYLTREGIYIVEDVDPAYMAYFSDKLDTFKVRLVTQTDSDMNPTDHLIVISLRDDTDKA